MFYHCFRQIENVSGKEFADQLLPQLIKSKSIDTGKIKEFVAKKTKSLLRLGKPELKFISCLYYKKEYLYGLLFDNHALQEHPEYKRLLQQLENF